MTYLKLCSKTGITVLRVLVLLMVVWGAYESVTTVFNAADATMGLMASVNLVAIVALSGLVVKLTRDYFEQQRKGQPRFDPAQSPELDGKIDGVIWRSH